MLLFILALLCDLLRKATTSRKGMKMNPQKIYFRMKRKKEGRKEESIKKLLLK